MKKKNKKDKLIGNIVIGITTLISILFIILITILKFIPLKYYILIFLLIIIFNLILIFLIKKGKKIVRIISLIISIIMSLILIIISSNVMKTNNVLENMLINYKVHNYSVIVLKDSNYEKIEELENKLVGYYDNKIDESQVILDKLKEKIEVVPNKYDDIDKTTSGLFNEEVDMIVLEDSYIKMLDEESDFSDKTKVIYKFKIKIKVNDISKDIDVTKDSFNIYLSGIDTYGEVSSVSRSDVNIIATVNPKTHQILLTSIPRDTYVKLPDTTGYKDKLTHAGLYGIDKSISTIEEFLDIDINYYFKVNFTSVIDIVNTLGGVNVYSDYSFTSMDGYNYKKGYNNVNGEQALSFVRERKAFLEGDIQRGKNQQALIEALVRKCISPSIITKYSSLLDSINGKFATNMKVNRIMELVNMQLDGNYDWTVTSTHINGEGSSEYTYSYSGQKLYVMIPDTDSVNEVKNLIDDVMNGRKLDSSYTEEQPGGYVSKSPIINNNNNTNNSKQEETPKEEIKEEENTDNPLEDLLPNEEDKIEDDSNLIPDDNTNIDDNLNNNDNNNNNNDNSNNEIDDPILNIPNKEGN